MYKRFRIEWCLTSTNLYFDLHEYKIDLERFYTLLAGFHHQNPLLNDKRTIPGQSESLDESTDRKCIGED